MHLSSRTRDRAILTVLFGVAAVLLVIALILWRHDSDADARGGSGSQLGDGTSDPLALPPQVAGDQKDSLDNLFKNGNAGSGALTASSGRGAKHRVTIRVTADGSMYVGFLFRDGLGAGVFVTSNRYQVSRVVRGELTAAKVGLQVVDSTRATCAIYIDGKKVTSHTARGRGEFTSCTA